MSQKLGIVENLEKLLTNIVGFLLLLQMKFWAKVHGINSSKDRTMNSLSIISLVAFHLQACEYFAFN